MWDSIKTFFSKLFSKAKTFTQSFFETFLSYAEEHIDDVLAEAAIAGRDAAEATDKKGLAKLEYAAAQALIVLGTSAASYAIGDVYTACQIAWANAQKAE